MAFIDFKAIKALVSLHQVASWLGLEVKNNRCQCLVNRGDQRELVLSPDKSLWHCFGCQNSGRTDGKNGGDQIELVAHVRGISQKQAAQELQKHFQGTPPKKRGTPPVGGFTDLTYEHERVQAHGLRPERAEELGIGFRSKGTTPQAVLVPMRKQGCTCGGEQHYVWEDKDGKMHIPKQVL